MLSNTYFWLRSSRFKIFRICRETSSPTYRKKLPRNSTRISKSNLKEDSESFLILISFRAQNTSCIGDLLSVVDIKFTACRHQSKNSWGKSSL